MLIVYKGNISRGGNVIIALGPKWRVHYYAHLDSINSDTGVIVKAGTGIGQVGATGNALGKQPHLHYSIVSLIPRPWRIDSSTQGYKKMFYINPISYLADDHG
jgi:murein DD-endopeptidase MepM/ murein hydrolase activator NlpD